MAALDDTINYLKTDYQSLVDPLKSYMAGGTVSPVVKEEYERAGTTLDETLSRKLGSDYMETTSGQSAMSKFEASKALAYDQSALQNMQASYQNYTALVSPMLHATETQATLDAQHENVLAQIEGAKDVARIQGEYDIQKQEIASEAQKYGYDQARASAMEVAQIKAQTDLEAIAKEFEAEIYKVDQTIAANKYIAELNSKTQLDLQQMENDFATWKATYDRETDLLKLDTLKDLSEMQAKYSLGTVFTGKTLDWFLGTGSYSGGGTPGYKVVGDILAGKTTVGEVLSSTPAGEAYDYISGLFGVGDVAAPTEFGTTMTAEMLGGDLLSYTPELVYGGATAAEGLAGTAAAADIISGTEAGTLSALGTGEAATSAAGMSTLAAGGAFAGFAGGSLLAYNAFKGKSNVGGAQFLQAYLSGVAPGTPIGNQTMPTINDDALGRSFVSSMLGVNQPGTTVSETSVGKYWDYSTDFEGFISDIIAKKYTAEEINKLLPNYTKTYTMPPGMGS